MNALQIMSPRYNVINWSEIETNWHQIPLLFKTFHNIYDINTINRLQWFYINGENGLNCFGEYIHPNIIGLVLDTIFEVQNLKLVLPNILDLEDEIDQEVYSKSVLPIAYCPGGELLMLGIGEDNSDKIYYYVRYNDEKLKFIANNIFEFFRDYQIKIDEFYLFGTPLSQLYRNWGEDFWRVREE